MRAAWLCVVAMLAAPGLASADGQASAGVKRLDIDDERQLKEGLLALAQAALPPGFSLDRQRAWIDLSGSLPRGSYEVRPSWTADTDVPPLPLTFELRPVSGAEGDSSERFAHRAPIRVTLAAPLLREVLVGSRRLRKGSAVACSDLDPQLREVRHVPKLPLRGPCEIGSQSVALRDIGAGDVIRVADVGRAPDVMTGSPVRMRVATNGVSVTVTTIALADAMVGDQVDVRWLRPRRTFKTLVTGPGSVQLLSESL
jgi:flagella basal body P-ring formation protein FlgA